MGGVSGIARRIVFNWWAFGAAVLLVGAVLCCSAFVAHRRMDAMAAIERLGGDVEQNFGGSSRRAGAPLCYLYVRVERINLENRPVTDEDLAPLWDGCATVRRLDLAGTKITDRAMAGIGTLRRLEYLNVNDTMVSDEGVGYLKGLQRLESLYLERTEVTDKTLAVVRAMPALEYLVVVETRISEAAVRELRRERPSLHVEWWPRPGDRHLRAERRIEALGGLVSPDRRAGIPNHAVVLNRRWRGNVADLQSIGELEAVSALGIGGKWFGDEQMRHLPRVKGLTRINLLNTAVTAAGLLQLRDFPDLKQCEITGTPVSEEILSELRRQRPAVRIKVLK